MKLIVGNKMPDFTVDTPYKRGISLNGLLSDDKTAILFLRYAGCTLCRFDMMILKDEYDKIEAAGGKVLVVLQSDPDKLSNELDKDYYPFEIICDPSQKLYKQLEIMPANSQEEMIGPGSMEKLGRVQTSGLTHGDYEGNELQLPAAFVVDKSLYVTYAHYAANITDMPDVDKIVQLLK
jgi:peroxiredoxin